MVLFTDQSLQELKQTLISKNTPFYKFLIKKLVKALFDKYEVGTEDFRSQFINISKEHFLEEYPTEVLNGLIGWNKRCGLWLLYWLSPALATNL